MPVLNPCILTSSMVNVSVCAECPSQFCSYTKKFAKNPRKGNYPLNHEKLVCFNPEESDYTGCSVCQNAENADMTDFKMHCMNCSGYHNLIGGGAKE